MTLREIDELAAGFASAHEALAGAVQELEQQLEETKRKHMGRIKRLVATAATRKTALHTAIDSERQLFKKPRTIILHGIKIGLTKQRGRLEFDDADAVVQRIRKLFQDTPDAARFIRSKEVPDLVALRDASVADLRKIGVTITPDGDKILIEPVAGDVEKVVAALLKDATDDITETEAA